MDEFLVSIILDQTKEFKHLPDYESIVSQYLSQFNLKVHDFNLYKLPSEQRYLLQQDARKTTLELLDQQELQFIPSTDINKQFQSFLVEYKKDFYQLKPLIQELEKRHQLKFYLNQQQFIKDIYFQANLGFERGISTVDQIEKYQKFVEDHFSELEISIISTNKTIFKIVK